MNNINDPLGLEEMTEEEETLCGNPHNNGENGPENCGECMAIKLNL